MYPQLPLPVQDRLISYPYASDIAFASSMTAVTDGMGAAQFSWLSLPERVNRRGVYQIRFAYHRSSPLEPHLLPADVLVYLRAGPPRSLRLLRAPSPVIGGNDGAPNFKTPLLAVPPVLTVLDRAGNLHSQTPLLVTASVNNLPPSINAVLLSVAAATLRGQSATSDSYGFADFANLTFVGQWDKSYDVTFKSAALPADVSVTAHIKVEACRVPNTVTNEKTECVCKLGYYHDPQANSHCVQCARGLYRDSLAAASCSVCPAHMSTFVSPATR